MGKRKTRGICEYCGADYTCGWMKRHIKDCKAIREELTSGKKATHEIVVLEVKAHYQPAYWLFLGMSGDTTLEALDIFLRNIWLECCGHLSCFRINGRSYGSEYTYDVCDHDMDVSAQSTLYEGLKFTHEYDFGSTTELDLQVIAKMTGKLAKGNILLLARNEPPKIQCDICGENFAVVLCFNCMAEYGYPTFLCEACEVTHKAETNHEKTASIANSPRMGVCGYIGSKD